MADWTWQDELKWGEFVGVEAANGLLVLTDPGDPTFTRNSVAYLSNGVEVPSGQPRIEAVDGRAGVWVEEGTTNLVTDAATLANHSLWTPGATAEITDLGSTISNGVAHVYFQRTGTTGSDRRLITSTAQTTYPFTIDKTKDYTVSIKFKLLQAVSDPTFYIRGPVVDNASYSEKPFASYNCSTHAVTGQNGAVVLENELLPDGYRRIAVRIPASFWTGSGNTCLIGIFTGWRQLGVYEYYYEKPQLEQKPYRTSWCLGTRSPESLAIPASVLNPAEGAIEAWVYVPGPGLGPQKSASNSYILAISDNPLHPYQNTIALRHTTGYGWGAWTVDSAGNSSQAHAGLANDFPAGWHLIAMRWSTAELVLFLDGVRQAATPNPSLPSSLAASASIGNWVAYSLFANTLIDSLRISRRARTDEEIAAAYAAGTLEADEDTTYLLRPVLPPALRHGAGGWRRRRIYVPIGRVGTSRIQFQRAGDATVRVAVGGGPEADVVPGSPIAPQGTWLWNVPIDIRQSLVSQNLPASQPRIWGLYVEADRIPWRAPGNVSAQDMNRVEEAAAADAGAVSAQGALLVGDAEGRLTELPGGAEGKVLVIGPSGVPEWGDLPSVVADEDLVVALVDWDPIMTLEG